MNQPRTKNFNPEDDIMLTCQCGHPECDKRLVSQSHLNRCQVVRDDLGHGLPVRSGGRCPLHPDELHRKTPADHQKGEGLDVGVTGATRGNVVRAGIKAGCNAIGIAKTFVHLGYRADLPPGHVTMWVY